MYTLDERIGRQHLQRATVLDRHGRVVADPDDQGGRRRRHPPPNPIDQGALADVRDALSSSATGRTQRRASP
jgi:hypothetical protein